MGNAKPTQREEERKDIVICHIMTFQLTTDHIYNGGLMRLQFLWPSDVVIPRS